ncbi:hypothetical protein K2173_002163 [Erythroxylum novogranatense]|uniref:Pentatricopeptide repeat-containing protein n=1 Tax=Erythroxylum novogranatense TaxID=1862640 RepID=A0AAV8SQL4_9ROSI|nr:hypothetical protein K2173_002163 [Erythroxylum novogranatense]
MYTVTINKKNFKMIYAALSKRRFRTWVYTNIVRSSLFWFIIPRHFSVLIEDPVLDFDEISTSEAPSSDPHSKPKTKRTSGVEDQRIRGKHQVPGKLEDVICEMMANQAWTTGLQNSIRSLVPEFSHSLVYNVLHGARESEHALQFFRWVERSGLFNHDSETYLKMIHILGRASKLNHARCILLDMARKGIQYDENMFMELIDGYGKAGIVQEAVKIFDKMKELGVEKSVKSYDTLFKLIMRRGRYIMAERYFNKMLGERIEPTTHTYNILLWGFFLSQRLETAMRFFEDMKSRRLPPDIVTYNVMINGYIRFKKLEEAEKLFMEMKRKNINPSVMSYTTMIKGYVAVDRVADGKKLLEEMISVGIKPAAVTYSTLFPGFCDAGKENRV